jgi:hypothetical protein
MLNERPRHSAQDVEDLLARGRRLLHAAADRVHLLELAEHLHEDPSTLRNQLERRERKRPSADLLLVTYLLDEQLQEDMARLVGKELSEPPDLTPEQFAREAVAYAQQHADRTTAAHLVELYRRVRSGEATKLREVGT